MADVSVQMGVSGVSQFKQGMAQAQASVKSIDAALKLNEKQFKATGDAEAYMQNKTTQLNQKLQAQQSAVKNAEQALKAMKDSGVDPLSVSYQKMETQLLNAQSALLDTQNEINNLGAESADAAGKTDQLTNSLSGLNKKISLDQVISAIGSITSGMEKAAQKAVELGKQIWENITDSARWADDAATQAMILNMNVEDYQAYKKVFDTVGELTVAEWQKAADTSRALHAQLSLHPTASPLLASAARWVLHSVRLRVFSRDFSMHRTPPLRRSRPHISRLTYSKRSDLRSSLIGASRDTT